MKRKLITLLLCLSLAIATVGCGKNNAAAADTASDVDAASIVAEVALDSATMFTARDTEIGYDASTATKIALNNETVTITEGGVYLLSGSIADGQIVVDVTDSEKVQLVLSGITVNSNSSAPIYVKSANKVFITLATDSENTLSVGGEYAADAENNVDGAIFSKSDLTFNGTGKLTINANFGHGIVGKDDVAITDGTYSITAAGHGISANNSVRIADGTFSISAGKDGIHAEHATDETLGFVYIANGDFSISAEGDGISASGVAEIVDGNFEIKTGEGSASVTLQSDAAGFGMRDPFEAQTTADSETETDTVSQKGIKADGVLAIHTGVFNMDTVDDSFHAAGNIGLVDGVFTIKSGDDGIHSDAAVVIDAGDFAIPYCNEGIEGLSITINGGTFDIVSSDDGFNAAGGTETSSTPEQGGDPFAATDGASITINGGTITVVSDGDSLDSNNALTINGGTLNLTCNGNGNTAIDASGTFTHNGGDITTNDGSESQTGTGGGRPGGGQHPDHERPGKMMPPDGNTATGNTATGNTTTGNTATGNTATDDTAAKS